MVPVIFIDPEGGLSKGRALINPRYVQMVIPAKIPRIGRLAYQVFFIDHTQMYIEQSPDVWEALVNDGVTKTASPFSPEERAWMKERQEGKGLGQVPTSDVLRD